MKICILYGSPRKKNTYAAVQQIKERLRLHEEVEFVEYILQKEPHDFCCGCYTCINGAEEKCPHAAHVQPVIQAMRGADGLIFATPVYVMDMTAQMKAFLDHTGYFYMVHLSLIHIFWPFSNACRVAWSMLVETRTSEGTVGLRSLG